MKKLYNLLAASLVLATSSFPAFAEETFEKIAFMGDNVFINDQPLAWEPTAPVVVELNPETGNFEFTARFVNEKSLWQMYTNSIGEANWKAIKGSIYTPNFITAFADMDPQPEDLMINIGGTDCFNKAYLAQAVGKPVPCGITPDGGFWVGGKAEQELTYEIVLTSDLSSMTIKSAEYIQPEIEYPETLYLYGNATPGGWDLEKTTPMTNLGKGVYRYVGELKSGAFQIYGENPAICGTNNKAYGPSSAQDISTWDFSGTINYYENNRPSNCYYKVMDGQTCNYILTVDLANNTISTIANDLYLVGQPTDWSFVPMENEGDRVFTYKGYLTPGGFCFTTLQGWSVKIAPNGEAVFGLAGYTNNTLKFGSNDVANSKYEGYFIVSADLKNKVLTTRTYNPDPVETLFVACDGEYKEMYTGGDGTYEWGGKLTGDFTLTPKQEAYPCYMPEEEAVAVPNGGIKDGKMIFNVTAANNLSNKWKIDAAGDYTIKVNPATMNVSVVKGIHTGLTDVIFDEDANAPAEFYDLMGRKVENPSNGLYIRVQGSTTRKVIIK